jgi:hypothetical protein
MYRPSVAQSERYTPVLRTKVNVEGNNSVRVWKVVSCDGARCLYRPGTVADIVKSASFWVNVQMTGVFFLARLFGVTLVTTDLLVFPKEEGAFPFQTGLAMRHVPAAVSLDDDDDELEAVG